MELKVGRFRAQKRKHFFRQHTVKSMELTSAGTAANLSGFKTELGKFIEEERAINGCKPQRLCSASTVGGDMLWLFQSRGATAKKALS